VSALENTAVNSQQCTSKNENYLECNDKPAGDEATTAVEVAREFGNM